MMDTSLKTNIDMISWYVEVLQVEYYNSCDFLLVLVEQRDQWRGERMCWAVKGQDCYLDSSITRRGSTIYIPLFCVTEDQTLTYMLPGQMGMHMLPVKPVRHCTLSVSFTCGFESLNQGNIGRNLYSKALICNSGECREATIYVQTETINSDHSY